VSAGTELNSIFLVAPRGAEKLSAPSGAGAGAYPAASCRGLAEQAFAGEYAWPESSSTIARIARMRASPAAKVRVGLRILNLARPELVLATPCYARREVLGVLVVDHGMGNLKLFWRAIASTAAVATLPAFAQVADFQIVWVNVGEAAAAVNGKPARAGRQLFMAPDLVEFSLNKVTIAKVDVEPSTISLKVGERFCLTSLDIHATTEERTDVRDAPLSVSVRQDHRERLDMQRGRKNICFKPEAGGEYPVRFNSLLPARDGTTRGAQIFLRVADGTETETATASDN
jgi:hypothetical protein